MEKTKKVAVVIPSYKVTRHIIDVISGIGHEVSHIYVVDDACPDGSGNLVIQQCQDSRVRVLFHRKNQGVGGAVMTGYQAAIKDGVEVIIKLDGDGQMDPKLIPLFIEPILRGEADYTKGNRFYDLEELHRMPKIRLFGNAVLSFMSKISSGYWDLFDPTNGFTAIHAAVAQRLPCQKIDQRYFYETDILFRLNTLRAVVLDIPMTAQYGDEVSNLKIQRIISEFLYKHARNFTKRIFYNYYLRDMSLASIELPIGIGMLFFGMGFGVYHWIESSIRGLITPAGTIMLAVLPILMGVQFILAFLSYDIESVPRRPIHRRFMLR